jgi:hydrogenase expression/formation protein HypE
MAEDVFTLSCPVPLPGDETIKLAHGGGGRLTERLLDTIFRPAFDGPELARRHDGALLNLSGPVAFSTDSYVVRPLFFPGGDIGTLAVNGTVNDLAMCGSRPSFISVAFILEEGLDTALLGRIVASMRDAACAAGVHIVTGDLKVVDRGKADGVFINTAGIGTIVAQHPVEPASVKVGDAVILSGDIGRHGIAVMAAREHLGFESTITSDCASLAAPVLALLDSGVSVHCLRDLTRGGLATGLVEIAEAAQLAIESDELAIPVRDDVAAACEILGLDPLHVANEGRFVAFVDPADAESALATLHGFDISSQATVIGMVTDRAAGRVTCRGPIGVDRVIDMLSGEQLPRIC